MEEDKTKITVSVSLENGGEKRTITSTEETYDETWMNIFKMLTDVLAGLGYGMNEDIRFILENINGANAKEISDLIDKYLNKDID